MTPVEANTLLDIAKKSIDFPGLEHIRDAALRALRDGTLYTVSTPPSGDTDPQTLRSKIHATQK